MINTTILYNFNETINPLLMGINPDYPKECFISKGAKYSIECLYNTICPQFNNYFIHAGITLIIIYILSSWVLWWYFNKGYIHFTPYITYEQKVYWYMWIEQRVSNLLLIFICIVVWLSINMKFK